MTTESEAAAERAVDIETILRLMRKHNWNVATFSADKFSMAGDEAGSVWVHGTWKGDVE